MDVGISAEIGEKKEVKRDNEPNRSFLSKCCRVLYRTAVPNSANCLYTSPGRLTVTTTIYMSEFGEIFAVNSAHWPQAVLYEAVPNAGSW